jgi:hypothetical protein
VPAHTGRTPRRPASTLPRPSSRYNQYVNSIRTWAADADDIYSSSAAQTGGTRHIRFVHNASCQINVLEVVLSQAAINDFGTMIDELEAAGYDREDRKYMMFTDANELCGIGTYYNDDSSNQNNWNNFGPSWGRADSGCWDGHTAAHELGHNLGVVQNSAPHSTYNKPVGNPGGHCTDEYDVMCYSDWNPNTNQPPMSTSCSPSSTHDFRMDCNKDDYFNTSPPSGSYLATHWNIANNQFLMTSAGGGVNPTPPVVTIPRAYLSAPSTLGNPGNGSYTVHTMLRWTVSGADGITSQLLQWNVNGGGWTDVNPQPSGGQRQYEFDLRNGYTYQFRIQAGDALGATSTFAITHVFQSLVSHEYSSTLSYNGSYTAQTYGQALGTVNYKAVRWFDGTGSGAPTATKATYQFYGGRVSLVSAMGPDRSKAEIWLDGALKATLDLYNPTVRNRRVVWAANSLRRVGPNGGGAHTRDPLDQRQERRVERLSRRHRRHLGAEVDPCPRRMRW